MPVSLYSIANLRFSSQIDRHASKIKIEKRILAVKTDIEFI
jgi:hypothetical protein